MKIAVTSQGTDLGSPLDPRFGRCRYFIIIDPDTGESEAIENKSLQAPGSAGVQSAQFLAASGVTAVITGNVGPNALRALQGAGIKVYAAGTGDVKDAVKVYQNGRLEAISTATVDSHFGIGRRQK